MAKRYYYYKVTGKNKYIPVTVFLKAESQSEARNTFYIDHGGEITSNLRISAKEFKEASNIPLPLT